MFPGVVACPQLATAYDPRSPVVPTFPAQSWANAAQVELGEDSGRQGS